MGRQSTTEVTTTWHCDLCGFEEIKTASGGRDPRVDQIPEGWSWFMLFPECRVATFQFEVRFSSPKYRYSINTEDRPEAALACLTCSKTLSTRVRDLKAEDEAEVVKQQEEARASRWRRMTVPAWLLFLLLMGNLVMAYSLLARGLK